MKKRTVTIASEEVELDIVRSSRRTIALYVRPGGTILIRAPWWVPVYSLIQFINEKKTWIIRQREKVSTVKPASRQKQLHDGSLIPFLGRDITIRLSQGSRTAVTLEGEELFVTSGTDLFPDRVAALVDAWYLREAKKFFTSRTRELEVTHSDRLPQARSVSVRRMKSRWGSCHAGGDLWFNRELMKKDPEMADYVIIHELCHLVHHNHSRDFYALLAGIMPDFRDLKRRLGDA